MIWTLLSVFAAQFTLTALPLAAAALVSARLGVRRVPLLLGIALAVSGVAALLAFWAYFAWQRLGQAWTCLLPALSIAAIVWALSGEGVDRRLLRRLAVPLGLWALGSAFVVFLGFVHGGVDDPLATSASRFSGPLPSDNDLPRFFAEWIYFNGHHGSPVLYGGEWHLSDRPPLQIGYVLTQRPLFWGAEGIHYEVLGVVTQQMWIVGMWCLLLAARVGRVTRALVVGAVLVSDVGVLNAFFVWPKLLPVGMLLAAAAPILTPLWKEVRTDTRLAALVAALVGLALLAHGGSMFGVIPLLAVAAIRGLPSPRGLGVAVAVGLALLVPWAAYQKYEDPPGNRVTKWMLAGVGEIDDRGLRETIVDSYSEAGFGGAVDNKVENFATMVGVPAAEWLGNAAEALADGDLEQTVAEVRTAFFFYLVPSLGLLVFALLPMAALRGRARQRPREWELALRCLLTAGIGCLAWGLIMFGNFESRSIIHQGSYLLPVLSFCALVCGLRAVLPTFAVYFTVAAQALMLAFFVPSLTPPPGTSYSAAAALLCAAALAGFVALSLRREPDRADEDADPAAAPAAVPGAA